MGEGLLSLGVCGGGSLTLHAVLAGVPGAAAGYHGEALLLQRDQGLPVPGEAREVRSTPLPRLLQGSLTPRGLS